MAFENWLAHRFDNHPDDVQKILNRFAAWHHLRRLREMDRNGRLHVGPVHNAKQEITVAANLLTYLAEQGHTLQEMRQHHLDTWLAPGPSTRYTARTFVIWAIANNQLPKIKFPHRHPKQTPVLDQQERLRLLDNCFRDTNDALGYRAAAILLLLYAQPVTRISQLQIGDITTDDNGETKIRFGREHIPLPPPIAAILLRHIDNRPNTATAANHDATWVFPGTSPGQPIHRDRLMQQLRAMGINLRGARNSALRQLVLDMPAAIVAHTLGYSDQVIEKHAKHSGTVFAGYARRNVIGAGTTPTRGQEV
ncbi:hypothetical protein D1871_20330 [Nakamurella silvestris]|nr:hypothetical protein D1871_20330 [Nakamurella silvestris]